MLLNHLKVGLLQCNLNWQNPESNVQQLEETLLGKYDSKTLDLLVLPEMFTTGFSMNPDGLALNQNADVLFRMQNLSKLMDIRIAGSFIWKSEIGFTNRFLIFESGSINHISYDKHHLFSLGNENKYYQSGNKQVRWEILGWKIAPYVCYDLRFPEWCRNEGDVDLMLFTANWPSERDSHWKTLLRARAIENQCYVAGINRTGNDGNSISYSGQSTVYDPFGLQMNEYNDKNELKIITLSKKNILDIRKRYPFLRDRDAIFQKQNI